MIKQPYKIHGFQMCPLKAPDFPITPDFQLAPMASTAKAAKAVPAPAPATPSREYLRFEIVDFHCKGLSKTVPARHRDETFGLKIRG